MLEFSTSDSAETGLLLDIARDVVYREENTFKNHLGYGEIEYDILLEYLRYHELLVFAHLFFKKNNLKLPGEVENYLRNNFYANIFYAENLKNAFWDVTIALKEKNINSVPLKGMSLINTLYKNRPGRQSSDIDILIEETDLAAAEDVMLSLGYKKDLHGFSQSYWRNHQYHFVYTKESQSSYPVTVEVHWALDYRRSYKQLPLLWQRIQNHAISGQAPLAYLSREDELFSLALHLRHFGKILCIKNVCDIAILLNEYKNSMDWDYVLKECRRSRIGSTLFFCLTQAKLFFDVKFPPSVVQELEISPRKRKIIERFIKNKTFFRNTGSARDKKMYLYGHFLFFDNYYEPINYLLNIPQEQFARFYGLGPYSFKTKVIYKLRIPYIILKNISC
ncbi:MAG: nucleotidyltransferase family protein [Candidatus Omnitrophica bacterium]|nr:nucleotidyltransferase family protein [Candidatus Omnitrophota bacterium]